MGLSDPCTNSLDIIALHPVKKLSGINSMVLSEPIVDYLHIIDFKTVLKLHMIDPMEFSAPTEDSQPTLMM